MQGLCVHKLFMAIRVIVKLGNFHASTTGCHFRLRFNTESLAFERDLLRLLPRVTSCDDPRSGPWLLLRSDDALDANAGPNRAVL